MASWDSPQYRFEPDWTLDSKIKQAATEAERQRYAFAQAKGLNDAWSASLDEQGRPNEMAYIAHAKRLGLGPAATRQYWNEQTQQYADAASQAQNAMLIGAYGADPSKIKGEAPLPQVRQAPAMLADEFYRPPRGTTAPTVSGEPPAPGPGPTIPEPEGGNTVIVRGGGTQLPTGGVYQLPEIQGQEYGPTPREGVATEFARSIKPQSILGGPDAFFGGSTANAPTRDVTQLNPVAQDVLRTQMERSFATNGGDLQGAFNDAVAARRASLVKPSPAQYITTTQGGKPSLDMGAFQKALAEYVTKFANAPNEVISALPDQYKEQLSQSLQAHAQRNQDVEAQNRVITENRPYATATKQAGELSGMLSQDSNPEYAKVQIDPSLLADDPKKGAELRGRLLVRNKLIQQIPDIAKASTPTEKYTEAQKLINGIQQIEKMPNVESVHSQLLFSLMPNLTLPEAIKYGYIRQEGGVFSMAPGFIKTLITKTPPEEITQAFTKMVRDSPILLADLENASSANPSAIPMVQAPSYTDLPKAPGAAVPTQAPPQAPIAAAPQANPLDKLLAPPPRPSGPRKPPTADRRERAPSSNLPPLSFVTSNMKNGIARLTDPSGKTRSFRVVNGKVVEVK